MTQTYRTPAYVAPEETAETPRPKIAPPECVLVDALRDYYRPQHLAVEVVTDVLGDWMSAPSRRAFKAKVLRASHGANLDLWVWIDGNAKRRAERVVETDQYDNHAFVQRLADAVDECIRELAPSL